ncbi:beta-1,3-galactosyl-O-glycosyl-glycoprotein beta-1,6-N-acetylglucosaminyltransferase 3-like [Pomacea canaliculata]|uniref:beta-1,3-galactosyl-O-glycosyl-glycoprotein beta-1,6-N-acetylglucosaminyltransferase 3-like n=1 Tax=Pomacea canaliculata TaxID=400727 RepID=UPI000D73A571|nr:beta-1,3-galactosyl-O-glycosyl-glycoprotein beta-1,6-N-acetylglucosaminyltransferase 3-like [Pomacea canaliculata]
MEQKTAAFMSLVFVCFLVTLVYVSWVQVSIPPLYLPLVARGVNCTKVWQGVASEISLAKTLGSVPATRPKNFYYKITKDCPTYRRLTGYVEQVSEEEKAFPLAFSILLYKDVEQVERLLRAVYRPHNLYCLHSDLKASTQVQRQIRALVTCLPNVFQAPRQVDVRWGTFTVLEPELICMEALLRKSKKWRYFINLTGQEFPLKTNKELVAILKAYRGANDIFGKYAPSNAHRWDKAGPPPHNMTVAKGPVHMAASREFVDFCLHSTYARDFLEWIKKTDVPDESYFTTLNNQHQLGVPGAYTGELDSPRRQSVNRYKLWWSSEQNCDGQWVRDICNFGVGDIHRMVGSVFMFANKFSYDFQPQGFDCLEQWYFSRIQREEATGELDLDVQFYRDLDIVKHALRKNVTFPS